MAKFQMNVTLNTDELETVRVSDGASGNAATQLTKLDAGKFVKLTGDSQVGLCAVGDQIEWQLYTADDVAPADGFNLGAVQDEGRMKVTLDGLQGTPGTGAIAIGDYVVCGTVVPRGTSLNGAPPKVCKATAAPNTLLFKWRLVSILVGTTAVGSIGVIDSVGG